MDFAFNLNKLFREEITLIDNRLQPCRQHGIDRYGFQQLQKMLYEVVDKMGDASAKAQGLHGSITTGKKLELASHHLYLMIDRNGNDGKGSALGILKVGQKKLFVYDSLKAQHELEPLCVLDFYVHESRQRMGCGRKLFDFMLSRENIKVDHLAVDRPSPKFLSFLKKHYCLDTTIPQVNNFVIFQNFFDNRDDGRGRRNMAIESQGDQVISKRPNSGHRSNGLAFSNQIPAQNQNQFFELNRQQANHSAERSWTPSMARQSPSHMGAGELMYSRHRATPPQSGHTTPNCIASGRKTPTKSQYSQSQQQNHHQNQHQTHHQQQHKQPYQNCQHNQQQYHSRYPHQHQQTNITNKNYNDNFEQPMDDANFYRHLNAQSSPSTYYNMGTSLGSYRQGLSAYGPIEQLPSKPTIPNQRQPGSSFSTPNFGNRGRGEGPSSKDNLHTSPNQDALRSREVGGPSLAANSVAPQSQSDYPAASVVNRSDLPLSIPNEQTRVKAFSAQQQENIAHRPPSGKQNRSGLKRDNMQPPVLQRDGPPANYKDMFNLHQTYQGRNGHLNVPFGTSAVPVPAGPPGVSQYPRANTQDTSWTVGGVLREQRLNAPMSNRYYNSTRLW